MELNWEISANMQPYLFAWKTLFFSVSVAVLVEFEFFFLSCFTKIPLYSSLGFDQNRRVPPPTHTPPDCSKHHHSDSVTGRNTQAASQRLAPHHHGGLSVSSPGLSAHRGVSVIDWTRSCNVNGCDTERTRRPCTVKAKTTCGVFVSCLLDVCLLICWFGSCVSVVAWYPNFIPNLHVPWSLTVFPLYKNFHDFP